MRTVYEVKKKREFDRIIHVRVEYNDIRILSVPMSLLRRIEINEIIIIGL